MTNQAKAVLWIGLILIVVNLARQWSRIRTVIFTPGVPAGSGSSGSGGFPVPHLPFIPFFPGVPWLTNATPPAHQARMV